jgi:hypothetical protein
MPVIPRWLWQLWLAYVGIGTFIAVVWFGIMEGIAYFNRVSGDTLSEFVWSDHIPAVIFFMGMGFIVTGTVWLGLHFMSGGKWGI